MGDDRQTAFLRAHIAIDAGDRATLAAVLEETPEAVAETGGPNANLLLGMAAATGDVRLVGLVLDHGADLDGANVHGWTALHQAAYRGDVALIAHLREAGARADLHARGEGGTPLVVALFWGHDAAAEALAEPVAEPANLRVAAGLGDLVRLDALIGADPAALAPQAGAARGFFRPHSGFPDGFVPREDRAEILGEALAWAARNGREEALARLVAAGARPDADVYRGTALAWAAALGRTPTIRALVALGADPDARTTFGGPDHGEGATALHLAAGDGQEAAVEALLELGASRTVRDRLHRGRPADWAAHRGHEALATRLR